MMKSQDLVKNILNPTPWLFLGVAFLFLSSLGVAWRVGPLDSFFFIPFFVVQTLLLFIAFTPLHESTHRVAHPARFINELILRGCGALFLINSQYFRRLHIVHHAKVNTSFDPDHFSSNPYLVMRWIKSFILPLYYFYFGYSRMQDGWRFLLALGNSFCSILLLMVAAYWTGRWDVFVGLWLLPSYVSLSLLSFANTAFPHHPGKERSRYKATRVAYLPRWLQMIMCNQNLHLVHHLYPTIPWFKYPDKWDQIKEEALSKGARVVSYTRRAEPYRIFEEHERELGKKVYDRSLETYDKIYDRVSERGHRVYHRGMIYYDRGVRWLKSIREDL